MKNTLWSPDAFSKSFRNLSSFWAFFLSYQNTFTMRTSFFTRRHGCLDRKIFTSIGWSRKSVQRIGPISTAVRWSLLGINFYLNHGIKSLAIFINSQLYVIVYWWYYIISNVQIIFLWMETSDIWMFQTTFSRWSFLRIENQQLIKTLAKATSRLCPVTGL